MIPNFKFKIQNSKDWGESWGRRLGSRSECGYRTTPIAIGGISNTEVKCRNNTEVKCGENGKYRRGGDGKGGD
jgi:hypothetical protein